MIKIEHVQWRRGTAYYRRRIPKDIQHHFEGKEYLFLSLKSMDPVDATRRSQQKTQELDKEWSLL